MVIRVRVGATGDAAMLSLVLTFVQRFVQRSLRKQLTG